MNAMKQAKIHGGASSQVATFRLPIMEEPPLWMQRTPAPFFMNGQSERPRKRFAYESPIEVKSSTMIALWFPWRSLSERKVGAFKASVE
jgi:hypothetical protein